MAEDRAFVVVAALVVAGATACSGASGDTTTDAGDGSSQTPTSTGTVTTPTFSSSFIGYLDLTTGETSATQVVAHSSAIGVSPDGTRIAYADGGVVIAGLDGSNVQMLEGTRGDPTGPQWSPDGSSIVYQDAGNLYVVDMDHGRVRRITDLEGAGTANLSYVSPTFDPTGTTVMFNMPTVVRAQERYDLWSVPVTGGEPTLVRRGATFGDYSPDWTTFRLRAGRIDLTTDRGRHQHDLMAPFNLFDRRSTADDGARAMDRPARPCSGLRRGRRREF